MSHVKEWAFAARFGVVAIAMSAAGACGPLTDIDTDIDTDTDTDTEATSGALGTASIINVGQTERFVGSDRRCTYQPCKKRQGLKCVEYGPCQNQTWGERLHATNSAHKADRPFNAFGSGSEVGANWVYRGCGPSAAQNVLNYFGVHLTLAEVANNIETINVPFSSQIATKPDRLREGLELLLNKHGIGRFRVTRTNGGATDVGRALARTKHPVIALVHNGGHYQTITGYKSNPITNSVDINVDLVPYFFDAIDYPSDQSVSKVAENPNTPTDLAMNFTGAPEWLGIIPIGTGHYNSNTYLTIDRDGDFLASGQTLGRGRYLTSPDGRFKLLNKEDGNLVLSRSDGTALWATNTAGSGKQVMMQTDGNLVVYNKSGNAVWASNTNGYFGAYLRVQTDGNLVIYTPQGAAVWASNTCCQ